MGGKGGSVAKGVGGPKRRGWNEGAVPLRPYLRAFGRPSMEVDGPNSPTQVATRASPLRTTGASAPLVLGHSSSTPKFQPLTRLREPTHRVWNCA